MCERFELRVRYQHLYHQRVFHIIGMCVVLIC